MAEIFSSNKIDKQSISDIIIDSITGAIVSGELKRGEKIPTETELSESFGVSRNTIREATKVLITLGILEVRRPEGTYVADGFNDRIFNPLLYGLILEDGSSTSLLELRRILEVGIAQLAIENGTDKNIADIKTALDELTTAVEQDPKDYNHILSKDLAFHKTLEKAAHNPLIMKICTIINNLSIPSRSLTIKKMLKEDGMEFLVSCHVKIYEVIKDKNYDNVVHVIDNSYRWWKETLERKE